jgi:hypothetical protein
VNFSVLVHTSYPIIFLVYTDLPLLSFNSLSFPQARSIAQSGGILQSLVASAYILLYTTLLLRSPTASDSSVDIYVRVEPALISTLETNNGSFSRL